MKRIALIVVITLAFVGCNNPAVAPLDTAVNETLIPALEAYLANDPELADELRGAYEDEIIAIRRLIEEMGGTKMEVDDE